MNWTKLTTALSERAQKHLEQAKAFHREGRDEMARQELLCADIFSGLAESIYKGLL